jgi:hypothetical protein
VRFVFHDRPAANRMAARRQQSGDGIATDVGFFSARVADGENEAAHTHRRAAPVLID